MTRTLKPCGTPAAFMRHYRNDEEPCQPCRDAWNLDVQARRERARTQPAKPLDWVPTCRDCGRGMRPKHSRAKDYPGLTSYGAGSRCAACQSRRTRRAQGIQAAIPTPATCKHCDRPLRPKDAKLGDHPGTVQHAGHGACYSCYKRGGPPATGSRPLPPCEHCGITMRSYRADPADHPGTRVHSGHGLCTNCYSHLKRHGTLEGYQPNTTDDAEQARRALRAYLNRRPTTQKAAA